MSNVNANFRVKNLLEVLGTGLSTVAGNLTISGVVTAGSISTTGSISAASLTLASPLAVTSGGIGLSSLTTGNYLYASSSTTFAQRTPNAVRGDIAATSFTASATAPVSPNIGDEWLIPASGKKYTWYTDADSSQWVEIESISMSGAAIQTYIQNTGPSATAPYLWIETGLGDSGEDYSVWFNDNT